MAQSEALVRTQDEIIKTPPSAFALRTFYVNSELGNILSCQIIQIAQAAGGVSFRQGELRIDATNVPAGINFWVDSNGSFFLDHNDPGTYTIQDGNLIYTTS